MSKARAAGRQFGRGLVWGHVWGMLLGLVLCACAEPQHASTCELQIDPAGFTDAELETIIAAAAEWDEALGGLVHVKPTLAPNGCEDSAHCIHAAGLDPSGDMYVTGRADMYRWNGMQWVGHQQRITIYLTAVHRHGPYADYWLRHTVLHELGHHMGLQHTNERDESDRATLMHPLGYGPPCVGPIELGHLGTLYGGRAERAHMHTTCETSDYTELAVQLEESGIE